MGFLRAWNTHKRIVSAPTPSLRILSRQLPQDPHDLSPHLGVDRQHVDELGKLACSRRSPPEELCGYHIAVGLIADQQASKLFAGVRRELVEDTSEGIVVHSAA